MLSRSGCGADCGRADQVERVGIGHDGQAEWVRLVARRERSPRGPCDNGR